MNHPSAQFVLDRADLLDQMVKRGGLSGGVGPVLEMVATAMRREAHLCTFTWLEMLRNDIPPETAATLAQDDMGFQLMLAIAELIGD